MLSAVLAMTVALVVEAQTPLRATAHESAPRQAALTKGDWVEVRGERQGYLEVYDHRRERPGYVRPSAVRAYDLEEAAAPTLGALVDFLKDAPGEESLGIGYAALFLRAAPASAVGADLFDALGTMASRLGERASARVAKAGDANVAAELETAESYGVKFVSVMRDGAARVCYDGEAFRRVLALGGTPRERVRAALALSEPECVDPSAGQTEALARLRWEAGVIDEALTPKASAEVPAHERARFELRRSIVNASLAYLAARAGEMNLAADASDTARRALMLADRAVLADEDRQTVEEAALRAATVRWASEAPPRQDAGGQLTVDVRAGEPGQTCVRVKPKDGASFEHCTYGLVWRSSLRIAPHDAAVTMVVEPLLGWSELLVVHRVATGWTADTITPATLDPDVGYVELAGFSPDGAHLLVVREARASGPLGSPHTLAPWIRRAFQDVRVSDLHVEKEASSLGSMPGSKRWETAEWKSRTLSLRGSGSPSL
jgi:hypothetical protein